MRYTYSRWDHSQDVERFDADDLMDALSEDLMTDGDVGNALQRIIRWGTQTPDGDQLPGMQSLLQRLRAERQRTLDAHNLEGLFDDIARRLAEIVASERETIDRKVASATGTEMASVMQRVAAQKREILDQLPRDPGRLVEELSDYEFLDEEARDHFQDLVAELQRQMLDTRFEGIRSALGGMTGEDIAALTSMLRDLDQALRDHLDGEDADFSRFMEQHGRYFPGAGSFDEIVDRLQQQTQRMESLLRSMSPEMRRSLDELMSSLLADDALRASLDALNETLRSLTPFRRPAPGYPFGGDRSVPFEDALALMRHLQDLDQLERDMKRAQDVGSADRLDAGQVSDLIGPDAGQAVARMQQLNRVLEEAGYVSTQGGEPELTARGIRVIGEKALHDIFRHLDRDTFGNHPLVVSGSGVDRTDESKHYEFGDAFHLDMQRTVMNSVQREGAGSPVSLDVNDFEVFRTEQLAQSSTALLLDMSRSMPLRGCFVAAKKVALALNSLIRTQFPRDRLYIIGFSDFARQLQPEDLHQITWGDYVYGTNMQHGFMVARRLLGKEKSGNRQIILITDGEPTAHFEGDRVHFAYPPTFRTFQETLREVKRCTRERITINTFMLERSHYLADFVNQMTRINHGRAFFATPERLGDYILVDYVANKGQNASVARRR